MANGRHPLHFAQLKTVGSHDLHLRIVDHLARSHEPRATSHKPQATSHEPRATSHEPAIVIAASGMCAGGRIVNYLKAMVGDPRHDTLFCGYQAAGTPGRAIQQHGPRGGHVLLDGERFEIRAQVHTLGGYSAHADQKDLLNFIGRMQRKPRRMRVLHGDEAAKAALAGLLRGQHAGMEVVVP